MISNDIKNIKKCIKKEIIKMITKIKEILADQLDIELEDIKDDSDIQEDLEADSLDVMDIMTEIEDEFDIEVEDEAIEELRTPQKIAEYIEEKYELDTPIIEQTLSKDKSSSIYLFATIFFASFISLRDLLFRTLFNCFPISVETCTIHFFSVLSSIFGTFS